MGLYEILGLGASVVIAVSLMMRNLAHLRLVNTLGAVLFIIYGILIQAWSVAGMNIFIIGINLWHLTRKPNRIPDFRLYPVKDSQDPYLRIFWDYRASDVAQFQPDFRWESLKNERVVFILRETLPVSLLVLTPKEPGLYEIHLDYAVPEYRDTLAAKYFFKEGWKHLQLPNLQGFVTFARVSTHQEYLKALGFKPQQTIGELVEYRWDIS